MMDILAGQAAVDVRALPFAVLGWDEVEDAKKARPAPYLALLSALGV